jgi:hypothetical protein
MFWPSNDEFEEIRVAAVFDFFEQTGYQLPG